MTYSVIDKLFICYTITTYCNKSCFYCLNSINSNKKTFYTSTKPDSSKKYYKLILDKLDSLDIPLCLDITGGEPLCHNEIIYLLNYCIKLKNLEKLILSTNGDYLTSGIDNIMSKVKNSQIIISLHYPYNISIIKKLKKYHQIRIPYIPKFKEKLIQLDIDNLTFNKSALVQIYHPLVTYSQEDLDFIKSWNAKNNIPKDEPYIEAHTDKNKLCFSSGLNILPDGRWNTCSASNVYNQPIFVCKKEQILSNEPLICPSNSVCAFYNTHSRRI